MESTTATPPHLPPEQHRDPRWYPDRPGRPPDLRGHPAELPLRVRRLRQGRRDRRHPDDQGSRHQGARLTRRDTTRAAVAAYCIQRCCTTTSHPAKP